MATRADLRTQILGWLHRATLRAPIDFDVIGTFIAMGEADINKDLRARCMVTRAQQTVDGQYQPLPCDYIEALDLRMVPGGALLYEPRGAEGWPYYGAGGWAYVDPASSALSWSGPPRHYNVVGDQLEIWPYPSTDPYAGANPPLQLEMVYYAKQQLGPLDTDTTKVLTEYPDTYLYAALTHSAPFVRDDGRVATWQQQYQSQIFRANAEHERSRSQGSRLVQRFRGGWGRGSRRALAW
jgi:hypothetical protein